MTEAKAKKMTDIEELERKSPILYKWLGNRYLKHYLQYIYQKKTLKDIAVNVFLELATLFAHDRKPAGFEAQKLAFDADTQKIPPKYLFEQVDIRKVILDFVLLTAGTAVAHGTQVRLTAGTAVAHGTQVRLTAGTAVAHGTQVRLTAGSSMGPHNDLTLLTDRSSVAHTEHFSLDHEPARSSLAIQNTYFGFIVANVPSFAAYIVHHYPQCINWYAAKCEAFQILVTQQCQDEYANVELFRSVPQHIIETYPFEITVGNQGKTMYGNMFFYLFWRSHGRPIKPSLSINQSNTFKSDAYHFLRRICTLQPLEFWQSTTSPVTKSFTDATTLETPMKIADWYQHIFGASDHDVVYARARKLQNASTLYVIQWRARVSNVLMDLYPDIMTIIEAYVLHPRQVVLFV